MNRQFTYITDKTDAPSMPHLPKIMAVDIETTGLDLASDRIVGISFAFDSERGYYTKNISLLKKLLANTEVAKVFHNAVFDLSFLTRAGLSVNGRIDDTMLMANCVDPDQETLKLKDLSRILLGEPAIASAKNMYLWLDENKLTKADIHRAPAPILTAYAAEDAVNTFDLYYKLRNKLESIASWIKERGYNKTPIDCYLHEDRPIIPVVVAMKLAGCKLDLEATALKKQELTNRVAELKAKLPSDGVIQEAEEYLYEEEVKKRCAKNKNGKLKKELPRIVFNWDSNNHLKTLIFKILREQPTKVTKNGNASTDTTVLERLKERYTYIADFIEYKEVKKLVSTYLDNLLDIQRAGVVHADFNITGTATGRFSSSNPNMQNLPKHGGIKQLFVPRAGYKFIYADYSQLELRVAAHLSGDELLCRAYKEGLDLHRITAAEIFNKSETEVTKEERDLGKTTNFAIIYRAEGYRLAQILGYLDGVDMNDRDSVKKAVNRGDAIAKKLFGKYSGLKKYIDKQMRGLLQYGIACTEFGRVRRLPDIKSEERKKMNHAIKAGFNQPVQGTGAGITKKAMTELHKRGFCIVSQIHDAIIVEVPESDLEGRLVEMKNVMETTYKLNVPLVAETKILNSMDESDIYKGAA